ncbi:uncharacterized protein LOC134839309 [Symsagittifera roscoffensis]|uniref:uncharacterized protein LOC134839309 n=1 Tax=Symsagittifera roscoffensis TaxID=84072 RepID=UPI00307C8788
MSSAATKKSTPAKKTIKSTVPSHPTFNVMITKAIKDLKERGGSSKMAIVKYIEANFQAGNMVDHFVKLTLRKMCEENELVHASSNSTGAKGSFKIPAKETTTVKKPKAEAKTTVKKTASPKNNSPAKKTVAKSVKKNSPKKAAAKRVATDAKKAASSKVKATKETASKK